MIEHERSYVFTHGSAHRFLEEHGMSLYSKSDDPDPSVKVIKDCYLGQGMRVRKSWSTACLNLYTTFGNLIPGLFPGDADVSYVFTRKTGDKSKGYRFEFEEAISAELADSLVLDKKLCVKKIRKKIPVADKTYTVTMDFIEEPMKIAIMEIEALSEVVYPIPTDITQRLFGVSLKECPLCAFSLFNRHIGICGGPSSGKSETSKILSYVLNTKFNANSFHVAEFATTFIQKYDKTPNFWEEFFIWHGQHEREHNAETADIVLSDCPTFLTYIYLLHLPKDKFSPATALVLAKMYKRVLFDIEWYSDIIFLKLNKYKANNVRYQSEAEAKIIEQRIKMFLDDHRIAYSTYDYSQSDEILVDLFYINE